MAPWGRRIPWWLPAAALAASLAGAPALAEPGQAAEPPASGITTAVTIGPIALTLGLAAGLLWVGLRAARRPAPKWRSDAVATGRGALPQGRPGPARDPISIVRPTLSASAWACRNCGTNNLGGASCVVCNHPRHGG